MIVANMEAIQRSTVRYQVHTQCRCVTYYNERKHELHSSKRHSLIWRLDDGVKDNNKSHICVQIGWELVTQIYSRTTKQWPADAAVPHVIFNFRCIKKKAPRQGCLLLLNAYCLDSSLLVSLPREDARKIFENIQTGNINRKGPRE